MIRKATEADKPVIYQIWKELFSHDDNGYTDYYFKHVYETKYTWVSEVEHQIVSTLQMVPHVIMLGGKKIQASMILGVATIKKEQKKGHMKALMKVAIGVAESVEMVTLIQAYDPSIYRKYGFQMVYHRTKTMYRKEQIPIYKNLKVNESITIEELTKIYNAFTTRFDGFYVRNVAYFKQYKQEVICEGGRFAAYRNQDNEIEGYMIYYVMDGVCEVREIIYLNSWAFLGLMGYASRFKEKICVHTSSSEQILMLIPDGVMQNFPFLMVRINDYPLFNICYNTSIQSVEEAFACLNKPLWVHEYA